MTDNELPSEAEIAEASARAGLPELACGARADGGQLADELRVEVLAPADTLWAFSTVRLTLGPGAVNATGTFKPFHPGGSP